jgi:hypothetical protein
MDAEVPDAAYAVLVVEPDSIYPNHADSKANVL